MVEQTKACGAKLVQVQPNEMAVNLAFGRSAVVMIPAPCLDPNLAILSVELDLEFIPQHPIH